MSRSRFPASQLCVLLLSFLAACGGDDPGDTSSGPTSDSGDDSGSGTDTGTDTTSDSGTDTGSEPGELDPKYEQDGPFGVGNLTFSATDESRDRALTIEVWYPIAAPGDGASVADYVVDPANRSAYSDLLASAPPTCPSRETGATRDASPAATEGPFPLLVFSHCHNCVRFSGFSIAERLASHGFVVAAADHAGNTLFDDLAGNGVPLNSAFLKVRAADVRFVIDAMLDGQANGIEIDAERIGVYGHSFGAVTTGMVMQDDRRPAAGFAIASPFENPLLAGVEIDNITKPIGFLVAVEDNSITEIGNMFIRRNFTEAQVSVWKGEVADAGHWSFSDICGLHPQFRAGCGDAQRQTDGSPFTYLPVSEGIAIAQAYVTAFFSARLLSDDNADLYLETPDRFTGVSVAERNDD